MDGEEPRTGGGPPPERGEAVPDGGEKQCVNCGAALSRYSKFCSECGTEQSAEADQGETGRQWGGSSSGQSTGNRWTGDEGRSGGQDDSRRQSSRGQRGQGQQQRRQAEPQQRGGQYGRQPDRLQTAGPSSSTGLAGLAHILALFAGLFGPIILYAVTDDPFVKENAANATNWQIVLIVYNFSAFILIFVLAVIAEILALFAILAFVGLIGVNLIFIIVGTIKAINGEAWEYPITPDLL